MRALVTGGGGFLGRHIVAQLVDDGWRVRSFSRQCYSELEQLGVECFRGDIRDPEAVAAACRDCQAVFHTAAIPGIWGGWKKYYDTNTLGTRHVLDACRRAQVSRLVYTSSPSVTFNGADQCGVDESAPYPSSWLCNYPRSKALAEQMVLDADRPGEMRTCALRPHLIWGVGDPHLIPRLLERARRGHLRQVGDGKNLVDTIHVDNAAAAHLQAADGLLGDAPAAGKAYFISQGEPVNCWDWINEILTMARLAPIRRRVPFRVAWCAGAMLEAWHKAIGSQREPRMTRFLAAQLAKSHYFDISAARRDFDYEIRVSHSKAMSELGRSLGIAGK